MTARAIVLGFWDAMNSNDFTAASQHLTEGFEIYWPQTRELVKGRAGFAAYNSALPSAGPWRFDVKDVLDEDDRVVTNVAVSDGKLHARAITFHWTRNGLIHRQLEYWPDPNPSPEWAKPYVEIIDRPNFPA